MDQRPSVWGIGLSAGGFVAGVCLLVAVLSGVPFSLAWLPVGISLIVTFWCGLPVGVWLVVTGWDAFKALHAWRHPAQPPKPPAAAPPPTIIIRQVPRTDKGRELPPLPMAEAKSARWTAWQLGAENWLGWYALLRATTSGAMVGKFRAFKDNTGWGAFTDELTRVKLVDKVNGRRAVLALPLAEVEARIRSGEIDWREDADPPAVAPPTLPPTLVPVTLEGSVA